MYWAMEKSVLVDHIYFFCSLEGKVVISNYFFSFRQVNMI